MKENEAGKGEQPKFWWKLYSIDGVVNEESVNDAISKGFNVKLEDGKPIIMSPSPYLPHIKCILMEKYLGNCHDRESSV